MNRQLAELRQQQAHAEAEWAGLIERAVQATALAETLQKQVHDTTELEVSCGLDMPTTRITAHWL